MLIAFSLICMCTFWFCFFFSFRQQLQVLVCWAEIPREAVVSVSRLAVWQCPWRCWTLCDTQRSCPKSDWRNCWSLSASPSPKCKGKIRHGASQGRRWVKISFSLCLPPLYTVAERRQRKRNSRVQWKAEGSQWAHRWLSAAGWGDLVLHCCLVLRDNLCIIL